MRRPIIHLALAAIMVAAGGPSTARATTEEDSSGLDAGASLALFVADVVTAGFAAAAVPRDGSLFWSMVAIGVGAGSVVAYDELDDAWEIVRPAGMVAMAAGVIGLVRVVQTSGPVDDTSRIAPHLLRDGSWGVSFQLSF